MLFIASNPTNMSDASKQPTLYGMQISAGCRLATWAANISEVAVAWQEINLMQGEHKTPEFIRMTQGRHCIPALSHTLDDGTVLEMTESRAIARYLCSIGNGAVTTAFPKAPHLTAQIDELMDYDATCLYKRIGAVAYPRMGFSSTPPEEKDFEALRKSLSYIEARLSDTGFLVGGTLSVADLNLANTLSMLNMVSEIDVAQDFPVTNKWLAHLQTLGNYAEVVAPFEQFAASKRE